MAEKKLSYDLEVRPSGDLEAPERAAEGVEHLGDAARETSPTLERLEEAAEGAGRGLDKAGREAREAGEQADRSEGRFRRLRTTAADLKGLLLGGLGLGALVEMFKRLVSGGADFEEQIKRVGEISGASAEDLERIKQKALELGETTSKTATDAASAAEVLVRSGQSVEQALATLPPVLALAEAEGLSLAASADIVVGSLAAYGRGAEEATAQTDLLFKTSKSAKTDVSALGAAWAEAGPLARAAGQDFETTAASLGVLADSQLEGTKGGTALRGVLASLASVESPRARKALADLGLTADDVNPAMRDLVDIVETLAAAGLDMNQSLALVGREGASALLSLVSKKEKLSGLRDELKLLDNDTQKAAESIRDQLKGDLQGLDSAVGTVALTISQHMSPSLRAAVQDLTAFFRSSGEGATLVGKSLGTVIELINGSVALLAAGFSNLGELGKAAFSGLEVEILDFAATVAEAFGKIDLAQELQKKADEAAARNSESHQKIIDQGNAFQGHLQTILERVGGLWTQTADTVETSAGQVVGSTEKVEAASAGLADRGGSKINEFHEKWKQAMTGVSQAAALPKEKVEDLVQFFTDLDFPTISEQLAVATPEQEARLREEFDRLAALLASQAEELPRAVHDNLVLVAAELETELPAALERVGIAIDESAASAEQGQLRWVKVGDEMRLVPEQFREAGEEIELAQKLTAEQIQRAAEQGEAAAQKWKLVGDRFVRVGTTLQTESGRVDQAGSQVEQATEKFGNAAVNAGKGAEQVTEQVGKAADSVKQSADDAKESVAQTEAAAEAAKVSLDQAEQRFQAIKAAIEQPIVIQVEVDLSAVVDLRREVDLARADLQQLLAEGQAVREELL